MLPTKVGRAPAALNFADDTGWDTEQLWAPKWRRIVYVGQKNYHVLIITVTCICLS